MRRCLSLCLVLAASLGVAQSPRSLRGEQDAAVGAAEQRHALVIGNAAYPEGPLRNPVNDARAVAAALKGCGFEVVLRENASRREMQEAIRAFGDRLRGQAVGLFYFAGHGVQVKGVNHLIPVGARIEREDEVPYEGVEVGLVLDKMESAGNRLNILILDACRNNPFARSWRSAGDRGLAQVKAPTGTLIAYATAPGSTAADGEGAHGLYTEALLGQMREPGIELERMFKRVRERVLAASQGRQTPWESNSTVGDFSFLPGQAPAPAMAAPSSALPAAVSTGAEIDDRIAAYTRGDKDQAYDIGRAYRTGDLGAKPNATLAKEWFTKAAAHGDPEAFVELGVQYQLGIGTRQNAKEALKWFRKAAEAGNSRGQECLANALYHGEGTPQNRAEAARWFQKAAEQGDRPKAAAELGSMYLFGEGVKTDRAEALKWYLKADEGGERSVTTAIALLYEYGAPGVPSNHAEAVAWLQRGAIGGFAPAMLALAEAYAEGRIVRADPVEAFKWLTVNFEKDPDPSPSARKLLAKVTAQLNPADLARARSEAAELVAKYVTAQDREDKAYLATLPGR